MKNFLNLEKDLLSNIKKKYKLSSGVYETISSFSNRYGGYILLGVEEKEVKGRKIGNVVGINPQQIQEIKKDFVSTINNPNKFKPTLYLELEEFDYNGKTILWVYVPQTSQLCYYNNKIYDRNNDSDQDISNSTTRLNDIITRKSSSYFEQQVLPYADKSHLNLKLMSRVRKLVKSRDKNHPWIHMDDMQIIQSAGLYTHDLITGQKGFNIAALLLFGKAEAIKSCMPAYRIDAICRIKNKDRYDDRCIIDTNLIEAYDKLMEFCIKHMDNRFVLDKDISIDARELIVREVISNFLIHREYSSSFPAKLVIEKDLLWTENWSKARFNGKLELDTFSPYPKNPILANFFMNIGRADTLGSGMRNLYKYTKLYSHAEPVLTEGDIFKTLIPLSNPSDNSNDKSKNILQNKEKFRSNPTKKIVLEKIVQICENHSYSSLVINNIKKIYSKIGTNRVFGASDVRNILDCAQSTATDLIKRLRTIEVLISITGQGKGKYRFKNEHEIA